MQIVSLEVRHIRNRLRRPVKHASHARTDTDNLIVCCMLSDGSVGYGEGVPREYVTGDTVTSAIDTLKSTDFRTQFHPCPDFPTAVRLAERLKLAADPQDERMCLGNAARCAVEMAILDAYGRAFGEPLMNVTRLIAPDLYEPRESVQYSGVIMSSIGWKLRAICLAYRLLGFKQVKVKVGISGNDDLKRLKTIHRWCGRKIQLRVDANEAWTAENALENGRKLETIPIASIEQPLPYEQDQALPELCKALNTPIMLDESFCGEVDAERIIRTQSADLLNLRISKCGGFIPTLKLAELAARHGLGYQLGCQVGESGILSAAGRHFATSVREILAIEGSFDRRLVENRLTIEDITFSSWGGFAPMLPGSGLGVTIDRDQIDRITIQREVLID